MRGVINRPALKGERQIISSLHRLSWSCGALHGFLTITLQKIRITSQTPTTIAEIAYESCIFSLSFQRRKAYIPQRGNR
jgi:hypothetical protein